MTTRETWLYLIRLKRMKGGLDRDEERFLKEVRNEEFARRAQALSPLGILQRRIDDLINTIVEEVKSLCSNS